MLSSFDSEIRNKSKALTMLSAKINLFLIELIFKWSTMMLLALSTLCCWISRRLLLAIGVQEIFGLKERELYAARLCLFWSQILSRLFRKSLKFLTKRDTPASFKCNLLLLRCLLGLMFLCDIMPALFALHNSSKIRRLTNDSKLPMILNDCNWSLNHKHLGCKRTHNRFAKLAKWLSCVVSTYL